ncbi:2-oxo acid dehydrogenase subunit E2 [Streptomyces sp. NRRL F-5123]|uniref:2-oxo acid dehydrogenase subunit E2 n=1 Tax=Streptomyces sp. NRRL F-5123 TaxID=1463856 RepID=UPI0004E0E921|nr:2-oxo acid dehydrogenase subunit E2 [Streptomyces sp. NRRL F-5123]
MAELLVPKLNNNDTEYVLTDWLVDDGTPVSAGDPVAVVETSKAAEELEATATGALRHALAAGAVCRPGERIAAIDDGTQTAPVPAAAAAGAAGQLVTRPAQQLIDELGITAAEVEALGRAVVRREHVAALRPGGAAVNAPAGGGAAASVGAPAAVPGITPAPAVSAPAAAAPGALASPASGPGADVPGVTRAELPRVQRGVARAVDISHRTIPAAYTVVRMDLGPALAYAKRVTREVRRPVGAGELFVREVALLHADFPRFFGCVEGSTALLADAPHIGVTVDLGEGLFVPCVRDAAQLSIGEIATRLMKFRVAATTGAFRESDLTGANFTVTLHTDADVVLAVPFVLPGTACALAVTAPTDGSPANIGLAYDHRLINGREATLFLHALKNSMERLA